MSDDEANFYVERKARDWDDINFSSYFGHVTLDMSSPPIYPKYVTPTGSDYRVWKSFGHLGCIWELYKPTGLHYIYITLAAFSILDVFQSHMCKPHIRSTVVFVPYQYGQVGMPCLLLEYKWDIQRKSLILLP